MNACAVWAPPFCVYHQPRLEPCVSCVEVPAREPSTKRALVGERGGGAAGGSVVPLTAAIVRTWGSPAPKPFAAWSTVMRSPAAKFDADATRIVVSPAAAAAASVVLLSRKLVW